MPTVSVIIVTYNRATMVEEAINSVLAQTYTDYEIVVVDDGSIDNTQAVVTSLLDKVRYVYQPNQGRSSARNHGISLAKGKYIAFLDSDDLFLSHKLDTQVTCMEGNGDFAMSYTSAICIDEHGKELPSAYKATVSGWIYRQVAFYVPLVVILPTVMIRSEVLKEVGGFDETMERFEDTDMWRRIAKHYKVLAIPEPLSIIRTHSGNELTGQDLEKIFRALTYYVEKVFNEDRDVDEAFRRKGAGRFYRHYGQAALICPGQQCTARKFFVCSMRYWPFNVYVYLLFVSTFLNDRHLALVIKTVRGLRMFLRNIIRCKSGGA